jgi:hypothetical protein
VVHRQPIVEAPFAGKSSRDSVVELIHHFKVRVVDEAVVGNAWQINSAASFDAEID